MAGLCFMIRRVMNNHLLTVLTSDILHFPFLRPLLACGGILASTNCEYVQMNSFGKIHLGLRRFFAVGLKNSPQCSSIEDSFLDLD
jgi:hypothetical protein